ncbi:MAG: hypothetical protein KDH94_05455 [Coxiellaceae bacterium]|nr:hypothetical protein [Coxiellaceae bacterium]
MAQEKVHVFLLDYDHCLAPPFIGYSHKDAALTQYNKVLFSHIHRELVKCNASMLLWAAGQIVKASSLMHLIPRHSQTHARQKPLAACR